MLAILRYLTVFAFLCVSNPNAIELLQRRLDTAQQHEHLIYHPGHDHPHQHSEDQEQHEHGQTLYSQFPWQPASHVSFADWHVDIDVIGMPASFSALRTVDDSARRVVFITGPPAELATRHLTSLSISPNAPPFAALF